MQSFEFLPLLRLALLGGLWGFFLGACGNSDGEAVNSPSVVVSYVSSSTVSSVASSSPSEGTTVRP